MTRPDIAKPLLAWGGPTFRGECGHVGYLNWLAIPENYWSIAVFVLGGWVAYVASGGIRARHGPVADRAAFFGLCALVVLAFRWPALAVPHNLNVDEARVGAQALKTIIAPWPWQGFDSGTSGPFTSYVMTLPLLFGASMTFGWIHLGAMVIATGIVLSFALGAQTLWGTAVGRAVTAVPLTFFAMMTHPEFTHLSSELLPVLLLTTAFALLARAYVHGGSGWTYAIAGALAGLAPFVKLQSAPLAAYTVLLLAIVIASTREAVAVKRRYGAWLLGGLIAPAVAIIASSAAAGSLHDAYISYVAYNIAYANGTSWVDWHFILSATPSYQPYAVGAIALVVLASLAAAFVRPRRDEIVVAAAALGGLAISIYCVEAAHRPYPHYLTFAVVPTALLAGALLAVAGRAPFPAAWRLPSLPKPLIACLVAVTVPTLALDLAFGNALLGHVSTDPNANDPVVAAVRDIVRPGTTIAVWGWVPELYVYTNTRMATKEADDFQQLVPSPYEDYFRRRYMTAFRASQPAFFIDAVAPRSFGFHDRPTQGFETFPELSVEIAHDYREIGEVEGFRIYCRRQT